MRNPAIMLTAALTAACAAVGNGNPTTVATPDRLSEKAPAATVLSLEHVTTITNPAVYDLMSTDKGERSTPKTCSLGATTLEEIKVRSNAGMNAVITLRRGTDRRKVTIEDVPASGRPLLVCNGSDDFYYANPLGGYVVGYSADKAFAGQDPVRWKRSVTPFTTLEDPRVRNWPSVITLLQARQNLLLVEWFYREGEKTDFWHQVFDRDGNVKGTIGPSDFLVKTNDPDPWWILFQGGGNEVVNYVPQSLYRLRLATTSDPATAATNVLARLRATAVEQSQREPVTALSDNPVINHTIALLTPSRMAKTSTIEFCPSVPPSRAQYWLGRTYDAEVGTLAKNMLLRFWMETQDTAGGGNPIDQWFQAEIAPQEPMKTVLATFNPLDDTWIAQYQQALLKVGGPRLDYLFTKYVKPDFQISRQ